MHKKTAGVSLLDGERGGVIGRERETTRRFSSWTLEPFCWTRFTYEYERRERRRDLFLSVALVSLHSRAPKTFSSFLFYHGLPSSHFERQTSSETSEKKKERKREELINWERKRNNKEESKQTHNLLMLADVLSTATPSLPSKTRGWGCCWSPLHLTKVIITVRGKGKDEEDKEERERKRKEAIASEEEKRRSKLPMDGLLSERGRRKRGTRVCRCAFSPSLSSSLFLF